MPLRSVKMNRFIFGFQRRVWCPKWTPLSSSCFMLTTAIVQPFCMRGPARGPRSSVVAATGWRPPWRPAAPLPRRLPAWGLAGTEVATAPPCGGKENARSRPVADGSHDHHTCCRGVPSQGDRPSTDRAGGTGAAGCSANVDGVRARLLLVALCLALVPVPAAAEPADPAAPWTWPLAGGPALTRPFSLPAGPFGSGARGVDLSAGPAVVVEGAGAGAGALAGIVAGRTGVRVDHP